MTQNIQLPRREREKRRQRQEMLAAASELFSLKGYHNVSMNEIAEKSEFAIGTLYKFFNNKEDLYRSILIELAGRFYQALSQALEEGTDEIEKLRNYVRTKGAVFMDNVSIVRLFIAETRGTSFNLKAGMDVDIRRQYDQMMLTLAAIFERGIKREIFNDVADSYYLAIALDSICNAFLLLWLEHPERHFYPENADVILKIIFEGLIGPSASLTATIPSR